MISLFSFYQRFPGSSSDKVAQQWLRDKTFQPASHQRFYILGCESTPRLARVYLSVCHTQAYNPKNLIQ